jgi:erythromycin esterase
MKRVTIALVLISLVSLGCREDGPLQSPTAKLYDELEKNGFANKMVPFSPQPGNEVGDMQRLEAQFSGKQVIGFGEATHGTAEFQTVKHRMFQLLATRMGFKSLVIEENFSAVVTVNEYINTGMGNINTLLAGLRSSMFKTVEFKNLVNWMKAYNTGKTDAEKVQLFGMDAQNTGYSAKAVQQMVATYEPTYLTQYNQAAEAMLADLTNYPSEQAAIAALPQLKQQWAAVRQHIEAASSVYTTGAGAKGYALLQQHIAIVAQALNQFSAFVNGMNSGFAIRDKNMADNVKWAETFVGTGSKLMVWVHNGHINTQQQDYFGKGPINVLGTNLKAMYGSSFYSVAILFNQGAFSAVNANTGQNQVFTLAPYSKANMSVALARFNQPCFFYHLQGSGNSALDQLFNRSYRFYQLGAGYDNKLENAIWEYNLYKEFDGLVFISKTVAYTAL